MHPLIKILQNFLDKRKTGNVSFKGIISIGNQDIPIDTEINVFKGGITTVNVKETFEIPREESHGKNK